MSSEVLKELASQVVVLRQLKAAGYTLYIYDHLISLADEVSTIWSRPLSFGNLLYYINRFSFYATVLTILVSFIVDIPISICERYVKFEGFLTLINFSNVQLILILRIYCLYAKNTIIIFSLLTLWTASIGLWLYIAVATATALNLSPGSTHAVNGCFVTTSKSYGELIWGLPALIDLFIFILTLLRTYHGYRDRKKLIAGESLLNIMMRDGAAYFCVVFTLLLADVLCYLFAPFSLKTILSTFSLVMTSLLVARMQMNIRITAMRKNGTSDFEMTTIQFAENRKATSVYDTFFSLGDLGEVWTRSEESEESLHGPMDQGTQ